MERHSYAPSSVYSSDRPGTGTSMSSLQQRPPSQPPSYMNARVSQLQAQPVQHAQTHSIPRVPVPASPVSQAPTGLLLLAIAAVPDKELKSYVEALLARSPAAEVAILGTKEHESAIKQVKMDMYGLAGKLSLELGVQTCLRDRWGSGDVEDAIQEALGRKKVPLGSPNGSSNGAGRYGKEIKGVICCPQAEHGSDVLSLETEHLLQSWQSSVGFLHSVAKSAIPWMVTRAQSSSSRGRLQGPFLFTTNALSGVGKQSVHRPSMRALLDSLDRFYGPSGITFGYAEQELSFEPDSAPERLASRNGKLALQTNHGSTYYHHEDTSAGDSPTKLWGMWANANIE